MAMGGFHYFTLSNGTSDTHEMTHLDPLLREPGQEDMATSEETAVHPLTCKNVLSMVRQKQIRLPTEDEIQDRSKSDWLAKTLVILQTCWFVTQCIARRVEHLPITELEVITLAYAAMNLAIFMAWWNKPHNVDCPTRVFQEPSELVAGRDDGVWDKVVSIIMGLQDDLVALHERSNVPIFYAGDGDDDTVMIADSIVLAVGVAFGVIHCIPWSFTFPSHAEAVLWRVSSIAITSVPIFVFMAFMGAAVASETCFDGDDMLTYVIVPSMVLSGILYVIARFTTIILAFMSLSSLPPGAFEAVDWTIRIPHLS